MSDQEKVAGHYMHGNLLNEIIDGVTQLGKTTDSVTIEDLAPVDEFHVGGREASKAFLDQLGLGSEDHVLDIGCGIGGTSRFVAHRYKSRVSGIDLTPEYVDTGNEICRWLGLEDKVSLYQGTALDLEFENAVFDKAVMLHVGMNIEDKSALFGEIFRVLRPGGVLGIYDVMRTGEGELSYPFPWASSEASSALAPVEEYEKLLEQAGFKTIACRNRSRFAIEYFGRFKPKKGAPKGRPPLGLHIIMGNTAPIKAKNMALNITAGRISPVELIVRKP